VSLEPIERGLEIEQAQLRGFARSITEVEWLLLILVVLYLFIGNPELARSPAVIGTLLGFAGFVLLFRYTRPFGRLVHLKLVVEIFAMVAFLTAVLVFGGGVESPLINLYLLPIVAAALALGKRATVLVVLLVWVCYPLVRVLTMGLDSVDRAFAINAVGVLAPFVLVAFCTALLVENINIAKRRIRALSDRDELTGLYNMRGFNRMAEQEHDLASRTGRSYAVLIVDVEHLKVINETYGHDAGNRAIRLVADALVRLTRSSDVVARQGDDEFAVLLSEADQDIAEEVAQRIRNVVFATTLEVGATMVRVKVNVGAASFPQHGNSLQVVMAAADRFMYKDKEAREPPKGRLIIQKR
jgi:diguanylate cyclase (GGDEF)-like protein